MKTVRRLICVILCIFLLSININVSPIQAVEYRTVRVGFFSSEGYHMCDENGTKSGYGYDFLQMLLRYNNWEYEYVGYDSNWGDMLEMLDNGQIDMVSLANKTPEREEKYGFSDNPIGSSATIMSIGTHNEEIIAGQYDTYEGAVVGLVRNSVHNQYLEDYAKEHAFTYSAKYYDDIADLLTDLRSEDGGIDIAVTSNMRLLQDEVVLDEFHAQEYYVMTRKDDKELLNDINRGISQLNVYSQNWQANLYAEYYSGVNSHVIAFSIEEREYLNAFNGAETLKVTMNPELKPYSYYEDGEPKGIAVVLFQEIAQRLNLNYEILTPADRWEYKEQLNSGEADVDLTSYADYSLAQQYHLKETDAYINTTMAMLSRKDSQTAPEKMTVAVVREPTEYIGYNNELVYQHAYKEYESVQQCIDAVKNGKADATFLYVYMAEQAVSEDYTNRLQCSIMPEYAFSLAIGVKTDADYRLLSILNKGVNSLTDEYKQGVLLEESAKVMTQKNSLIAIAYDYPILVIIWVVLMISIVFAGILLKVRVRNQKALKLALDAARNASEEKGKFLSRMSHEIRTPLNAVIGYMDIAQSSQDNPNKVLHCIENSQSAAQHLLRIINDVLDISAIESGKLKIAQEEFHLKGQMTNLSSLYFHQCKNKNVNFHAVVSEVTEEWVIGDSLRLNQILMNLLSNAVKFTSENGTVTLSVTQKQIDEERLRMTFSVSDTGIGMSEEHLQKLFQPFEQESAATAKTYGGSGLGLSISYQLVQMMGGSITVESQQGVGTTFHVSLDFEKSKAEHPSLENMQVHRFSKVRALIVDDDQDTCAYVKALLKRCGVKSDVVYSGEMAIKKIKSRMGGDYMYDLCIMDLNMPGLNGIETAKVIKEQCGFAPPIVIATAYDTMELEDEAQAAGIEKIIAKPFFQSTMFDLLVSTYGKYDTEKPENKDMEQIRGLKILLAEDNPMNLEIAEEILQKAGLVVSAVTDGKQAYEQFQSAPAGTYNAILMDVQMPIMNGYEATEAIRSCGHPDAGTIPIVAMTANAFSEDIQEALSRGMNGHISKPVNYEKLYEVLNELCNQTA